MSRIELSTDEIKVIEKQLSGEYDPFDASETDMKAMNSVISKAESLLAELDAYDESGDDLIEWFYGKYKEQENV